MKKVLLLGVMFLSSCGPAMAEELRAQMRVWRSSAVTTTLNPILISSSPIIFHMVAGSGTVTNAGPSYFCLMRSTMDVPNYANAHSTVAFIPLNMSLLTGIPVQSGIGAPWDVFVDSHVFYTSQGGAVIQMLYDFYKYPQYDPSKKRDAN